jgi:protoporphyrinogen oxidase
LMVDLDALVFSDWLAHQDLTDPHLLWYLDYVCRDEYGAGIAHVSAWAGLHYFAARHGFALPGEAEPGHAVFTWPEGNAFVTRHMALALGDRLHTGWAVQQVMQERQHVQVRAQHTVTGEQVRWQARHVVLAQPAHVAARSLAGEPSATAQQVRQASGKLAQAAWVVVNLHLSRPLADRGGAAPAWDNVSFGPGQTGLGYVDASHQMLHRSPRAPTVLTHYRALGPGREARRALRDQPWMHWVHASVAEWQEAHPELRNRITEASVARYGHGMVVSAPGMLHWLMPLHQTTSARAGPTVHWAHSDASGMSTFEEAFAQGLAAGMEVARRKV